MKLVFDALEATVNKSTIYEFRNFLNNRSDVTKWFMCSDYCFDDKNKHNNVISFVIYPYIYDLEMWNDIIEKMQKKDLKHSRYISNEFCEFTQKGYFFSFNFILGKNCILEEWKNESFQKNLIDFYIEMITKWQDTASENSDKYKKMCKKLKDLRVETMRKNFNHKPLGRILEVAFLASYLKYLLYKEVNKIEIFSWLSDRDSITSWNNQIYWDFYHIISHSMISEKITCTKKMTRLRILK